MLRSLLSSQTSPTDIDLYTKHMRPCAVTDESGRVYDLSSLTAQSIEEEYKLQDDTGAEYRLNVCDRIWSETWNIASPETIGIYRQGAASGSHGGESLGCVAFQM